MIQRGPRAVKRARNQNKQQRRWYVVMTDVRGDDWATAPDHRISVHTDPDRALEHAWRMEQRHPHLSYSVNSPNGKKI